MVLFPQQLDKLGVAANQGLGWFEAAGRRPESWCQVLQGSDKGSTLKGPKVPEKSFTRRFEGSRKRSQLQINFEIEVPHKCSKVPDNKLNYRHKGFAFKGFR